MLFKFKEKKIVINAFVPEDFAYVKAYADLKPAARCFPQWWKDLDKEHFNTATGTLYTNIRSCAGFLNHFRRGFIVPMWCDLIIKVHADGSYNYRFSDDKSVIDLHSNDQTGEFYKDYHFLKITSPWYILSEKDMYFNYMPAVWHNTTPQPYVSPYGTMDFYYQHGSNLFLMVDKTKEHTVMVNFMQPMVHIMPLSDRQIDLRTEVISRSEYLKMANTNAKTSFTKKMANQKRVLEGKCPFKTLLRG